MSSQVHLMSFHKGDPSPFPLSLVGQSFSPYCGDERDGYWLLEYPDGWSGEISASSKREQIDGFQIDGIVVYRPPVSPEFWKSLFDLMMAASGCIFWPSGGCVIADPSVRGRLPEELVEALGEPIVVTTSGQFLEYIRKRFDRSSPAAPD